MIPFRGIIDSNSGISHVTVRRGDRKSQLPMHGSRKDPGNCLVNKILKDLGLKR
jgi:mRNA interferase HicA